MEIPILPWKGVLAHDIEDVGPNGPFIHWVFNAKDLFNIGTNRM